MTFPKRTIMHFKNVADRKSESGALRLSQIADRSPGSPSSTSIKGLCVYIKVNFSITYLYNVHT